jgi:GNAT superfamily N-acetyltransferase
MRSTLATRTYRGAKRFVRLLPRWLIRVRPFAVYEIPLRGGDVRLAAKAPETSCRVAWVQSIAEAAALRPLASDDNISAFDPSSHWAATAWLNGEVIGCAWIAAGTFTEAELGLQFELGPNEAWLFAAAVDPKWRNRGVYAQLLEFVTRELSNSGIERILLGVTFGNEPSRRAHARFGASRVASILAIHCLGWNVCLRSGQLKASPARLIRWRQPIRLAYSRPSGFSIGSVPASKGT